MSDYPDRLLIDNPRKDNVSKFHPAVAVLVPLAAILFQVYVPLFFKYLSYLELPLLVTVYFSLMRRHQISGTLIGASIGLAQDSLAHHPLGIEWNVQQAGFFRQSKTQARVVVTGIGTISPLGNTNEETWAKARHPASLPKVGRLLHARKKADLPGQVVPPHPKPMRPSRLRAFA